MTLAAVKAQFFDRDKVVSVMDKYTRRTLSRFGAFTMRRIRKTLKPKPYPSSPGSPPHVRPGSNYRKSILFSFSPSTKNVVIGPFLFTGSRRRKRIDKETVPEILEYGGKILVGQTMRAYRARPHVNPAFLIEVQRGDYLK